MEKKNHKKIRTKTSFWLKAWDSAVLEINNITEKLPKPLLVLSSSTYCKHSSLFIIRRSSKKPCKRGYKIQYCWYLLRQRGSRSITKSAETDTPWSKTSRLNDWKWLRLPRNGDCWIWNLLFINIQWCIQYWTSIFRHLVWDVVHSFKNKQKHLQRTMSCLLPI